MRKLSFLLLAGVLGLCSKIWVNAIRDPGAELGQGDWSTDKIDNADSARVSAHDSTRAYEGNCSFLTDTDKDPFLLYAQCDVWCYQQLKVPKAVKDIDSCFWSVFVTENGDIRMLAYYIRFHSRYGKRIAWLSGKGADVLNDSSYTIKVPLPEGSTWASYGGDLNNRWKIAEWLQTDTIVEIQLHSQGFKDIWWLGQEVSWDNVVLRSVAYYDYAAKSIDSDELTGLSFTPIATFANEGIKDDKDCWVYAEILEGSNRVYVDSQLVSIPKESSQQVTFADWTVGAGGPYTLRVYPILELDELSSDDTLEKVLSGIEEASLQTEPLQVTQVSSGILFTFAPGIVGELAIYDVTGRQVYVHHVTRNTRNTPGLTWDTSDIPAGLYFYWFVGADLMISDRLVVLH